VGAVERDDLGAGSPQRLQLRSATVRLREIESHTHGIRLVGARDIVGSVRKREEDAMSTTDGKRDRVLQLAKLLHGAEIGQYEQGGLRA
jgi:hypothetical protein